MPETTKRRVLRKMLTTATTVAVLLLVLWPQASTIEEAPLTANTAESPS